MPAAGPHSEDATQRFSTRTPAARDVGSKAYWTERLLHSKHVDSVTPAAAEAARRLSIGTPAELDADSRARWAEQRLHSEDANSTTEAAADAARDGSSAPVLLDLRIPDERSRSADAARCAPACSGVSRLPGLRNAARFLGEAHSSILPHSDSMRLDLPAFRVERAVQSALLQVLPPPAEAGLRWWSEAALRFGYRVDGRGSWRKPPAWLRTARVSAAERHATPPDAR